MSSAELTLTGRQVGNIYMSGEEVAACRSVFDIVDEDGSGCIAAAEIQKLLRLLRLPARQSEVLRMVEEIDKDGSGDVDFEEFLQMMANTRLQRYDKRQLLYSFNLLSEESALPNHISLVAVERALVTYCGAAEAEAQHLARQLLPPGVRLSSIDYHAVLAQYLS